MAILSKIKYRFERLLSEIYAVKPCENNQKVRIDCLQPRSNKSKFECKNCVVLNFMCSIIKILHLKYCRVYNA